MNLRAYAAKVTGEFSESAGLKMVDLRGVDMPKFTLPDWPKGVQVEGNLGKREYRALVREPGCNYVTKWKTGRCRISFRIYGDGRISFSFNTFLAFEVKFNPRLSSDTNPDYGQVGVEGDATSFSEIPESRLTALVLLERFQKDIAEIVSKTIDGLAKNNSRVCNLMPQFLAK